MNINLGKKQSQMHSTFFELNNISQSMIFSSDHPQYPNESKGM